MSFLKTNFEGKPSFFIESSSNEDLQVINEKIPKALMRPSSIKPADIALNYKQKTGSGNFGKAKGSVKALNERSAADVNLLNKLKPRQINIDKERLYEENLELKLANNNYKSEIVQLKTKIQQVKEKLGKKDENPEEKHYSSLKTPSLVVSLKQRVKDLKAQLQAKDEEIDRLAKNFKVSKINELESEVQALTNECTRLKRHLEELLRQNGEPNSDGFGNIVKDAFISENLSKENLNLHKNIAALKQELEKSKHRTPGSDVTVKKKVINRNEINLLKNEIARLKETNDTLTKAVNEAGLKETNYKEEVTKLRKIIKDLHNRALSSEKRPQELSIKAVDYPELIKQFKKPDQPASDAPQSKSLAGLIAQVVRTHKITTDTFFQGFEKSNKISFEETRDLLRKYNIELKSKQFSSVPQGFIKSENKIYLDALKIMTKEMMRSKSGSKEDTPLTFTIETPIVKADRNLSHLFKDVHKENAIEKPSKLLSKLQHQPIALSLYKEKPQPEQSALKKPVSKSMKTKKHEATVSSEDESKKEPKPKTKHLGEDRPKRSKQASKSSEKSISLASSTPPPNPDLQNLFQHISYRMQMNRLPKSKLLITLFGVADKEKLITSQDLANYLSKAPFNFTVPPNLDTLSLLTGPKSSIRAIGERLMQSIKDWEFFSKPDEELFDYQLGRIVSANKDALKSKCKEFDKENKGVIALREFTSVLQSLNIEIEDRMWRYMNLLFYSNESQLEVVPYRYFVKAYGNAVDEPEVMSRGGASESYDPQMITNFLEAVAGVLAQNCLSVAEVFECDEEGIVTPSQFLDGIKFVGFEDVDEEHILMVVEAIRYEGCEELCLHIEELNEIMGSFGANRMSEGPTATQKSFGSAHEESGRAEDRLEGGLIKLIPAGSMESQDMFVEEYDN